MEVMQVGNEKLERAKERVKTLKEFRIHVFVFAAVNPFLALLNYMTTGWEYLWFLFATIGWSIGLLIHAVVVFDLNPFFGKGWEEQKIKEFMNEDKD